MGPGSSRPRLFSCGSCIRAAPELGHAAVASAAIEQDRADGQQARGEKLAAAQLGCGTTDNTATTTAINLEHLGLVFGTG